jgi:4-hydroxythreonine-4-phosphate dehydrogenase
MAGLLAIALGDVTGIGPEVTLKALAAELGSGSARYLLIGDEACLRRLNAQLGLGVAWRRWGEKDPHTRVFVHQPLPASLPEDLPPGSAAAARAALAWLKEGAERCLRHEADALVTAPVNKEAILRAGLPFVGQTEFLSQLAGTDQTTMMLLGADDRERWLRVALATTHLPLKRVAAELSQARITLAIAQAATACRDLGLTRARIGVCGLNPHAGEGGAMGDEEQRVIAPAIAAARKLGLDVMGPLGADTLFHRAYQGEYDAVVAMYHDQGLAPLKMVAFDTGVNWTLGLPFLRTAPDHGTAYDIAGQGLANPSSMIAALRLVQLLLTRQARAAAPLL